jgi:Protein of unknown function, DUF547
MKYYLTILLFSIFLNSFAQDANSVDTPKIAFSHKIFNDLLKQHVNSSGAVNYKNLKKDKTKLQEYLTLLSKNVPSKAANKKASLAYWINAYNAFTLKLIIDHYPLKKITDLDNGKPWDVKWIELGSKKYSLNNIENDIIRPQYKDARIHFAVNCAAKSCPPLANEAFTEANITKLLEVRTKSFINSSANELTDGKATVSKIFDWYKDDFGVVIDFINKYGKTKLAATATVDYKEYNWNLNDN